MISDVEQCTKGLITTTDNLLARVTFFVNFMRLVTFLSFLVFGGKAAINGFQ